MDYERLMFTAIVMTPVLLFFAAMICWAINMEKKDWNGGHCPCGTRWRHYGNDSQGGRGYKCDACGDGIWISYAVDKYPKASNHAN